MWASHVDRGATASMSPPPRSRVPSRTGHRGRGELVCYRRHITKPTLHYQAAKNDFWGEKDARMAQRWPLTSRPARDARMPCAPARGAPA
eukprot:2751368-Prymnesium_polylepis.2